jgi:UDP:flavonoid glycosyltransferase YjiC (YdhE family)
MHFILATVGTDGDVFPYIGLAAVLRGRGLRVTLAAPEPYRGRAISLGFEFCPLVTADEASRMLANPDLWHPFRSGPMMARWGAPMIPRQYQVLAALAGQAESVIIANPGLLAARLVQEKLGTPMVSLLLQPGLLPSSAAPPEMPGGMTLPAWFPHALRPLYWLAVDGAGYMLVARSLNRIRSDLGLPPVRRLFCWWLSPELVIGLFPRWYAIPPPDWPPQLRLAGFGRFDGGRAELAEDLRTFCLEGSRPIAFTPGTGMRHSAGFFRMAVAVCELLGRRGLLLTKYAAVIPANLSPRIRHCAFAPFRQLLPLCSAAVHHGGIGTTAAALESACPQLVLPFAWDQPDNAARVARLGAGLTLGQRRRSRVQVSQALSRLTDANVHNRCKAIATQANGVDGLELAAGWVEEWAANHRKHSSVDSCVRQT